MKVSLIISTLPKTVYIGLISIVVIWLLFDIAIAIKKKKSIGIPIGLFLLIISGMLLIFDKCNMIDPILSKYTLIASFTTGFMGAGIAIYGGIRDFKRAGKKTSPAMKKFFIGWGIFMAICVVAGIIVFVGMNWLS